MNWSKWRGVDLSQSMQAAIFGFCNLAGGGIIYLFTIYAARRLSLIEFGELTSWTAYLSLGLAAAGLAQFGSNFFAASATTLRRLTFINLGVMTTLFLVPFLVPKAGWGAAGSVAVAGGFGLGWLMGQAQIRLFFVAMGVATVVSALGRFVMVELPFAVDGESLSFAWGVALASTPAILVLSVVFIWYPSVPVAAGNPDRRVREGLLSTIILAYASMIWPQIDVMVVHQSQSPEVIGEFARVSIIYKGVFYAFLIVTQVLLPHQIRSVQRESRPWQPRIQMLSVTLLVAAAVISLSGLAMSYISDEPLASKKLRWIWLSCSNTAVLINIFVHLQADTVKGRIADSGAIVLATTVFAAICVILKPSSVEAYLAAALAFNFFLWLIQGRRAAPSTNAQD